jgi:hypothetical protein
MNALAAEQPLAHTPNVPIKRSHSVFPATHTTKIGVEVFRTNEARTLWTCLPHPRKPTSVHAPASIRNSGLGRRLSRGGLGPQQVRHDPGYGAIIDYVFALRHVTADFSSRYDHVHQLGDLCRPTRSTW